MLSPEVLQHSRGMLGTNPASLLATAGRFGIDLSKWGVIRSRAELDEAHHKKLIDFTEFMSTGQATFAVRFTNPNVEVKPGSKRQAEVADMLPLPIQEMRQPGTTYRGRYLLLRCYQTPHYSPNMHSLFEDDFGDAVLVGFYGEKKDKKKIPAFHPGMKIIIKEPFFKTGADGVPFVRVDAAKDIASVQEVNIGPQERTVLDWKTLGNDYRRAGNLSAAAEAYRRGLHCEEVHRLATVLGNRSQAFLNVGNYSAALRDAASARVLCPTASNAKLWNREILAYLGVGNRRAAESTRLMALKVFPQEDAFHGLPCTPCRAREEDNAYDWWKDSSEDAVPVVAAMKGATVVSLHEAGNELFRQEKYHDSAQKYSEALALSSEDVVACLNNLCLVLLDTQKFEDAARAASTVLVLRPNNEKAKLRREDALTSLFPSTAHEARGKVQKSTVQHSADILRGVKEKVMCTHEQNEANLRMMKMLFSMLPEKKRKEFGFELLKPLDLDVVYPKHRGWPHGTDVAGASKMLRSASVLHEMIPLHRFHLFQKSGESEVHFLLKRLGDSRRLDWYLNAKAGDVLRRTDHFPTKYDPAVHQSYTNHVRRCQLVYAGETHIAVGFVDLAFFLNVDLKDSPRGGRLRFIGVDMSIYAVAKGRIVAAMLSEAVKALPESVLEVWYSTTWSNRTLRDFKAGIHACRGQLSAIAEDANTTDIQRLLEFWSVAERVPLADARRRWLEDLEGENNSPMTNFVNHQDLLDACYYELTGDFTIRPESQITDGTSSGSLTMFRLPGWLQSKAEHESVFHQFELKEVLAAAKRIDKKTTTLIQSLACTRLEQIKRLAAWVQNGTVTIDLIHGFLSRDNSALVQSLARLRAESMSWSNCLDYVPTVEFHQLAKSIASEDAIHVGYSMNWLQDTAGSCIADYKGHDDTLKLMLAASEQIIHKQYEVEGSLGILHFPPVSNAMNIGSISCALGLCFRKWIEYFFDSTRFGVPPLSVFEEALCPTFFNPFARGNFGIDFTWTYDMALRPNYIKRK